MILHVECRRFFAHLAIWTFRTNGTGPDCPLFIDQSCKQATVAKTCLVYFECSQDFQWLRNKENFKSEIVQLLTKRWDGPLACQDLHCLTGELISRVKSAISHVTDTRPDGGLRPPSSELVS